MQITVERKTRITVSSADVIKALKLAYPENLHIQALGDTTLLGGKYSLEITSVKTDVRPAD